GFFFQAGDGIRDFHVTGVQTCALPILIITFVVAVGVLVATAGGDARSTIAHLEEVQTTALQISRAGSALRGLVGDLSRVDRSERPEERRVGKECGREAGPRLLETKEFT